MKSEEVNREALIAAIETELPEMRQFLDLRTGDVVAVVNPELVKATDPDELDEIARDNLMLAERVRAEPERYEPVPSIAPEAAFRWIQEFISTIADASWRERLQKSVHDCSDDCFAAFRGSLQDAPEPERERWFAFRAEKLDEFLDAWLEGR